jgi:hypothetical protein
VSTHIVAGGEHILNDYDSGLTVQWLANDLESIAAGGRYRVRLTTSGKLEIEITKNEDDLELK